jgi:phosphatidylglycerophosphate synthase
VTTTAIIVCPEDGTPEAGLLELRIAGIAALPRALLTVRQAGLEPILIVASPAQRTATEPGVSADPRLAGRVAWARPDEALPPAGLVLSPLLVLEAGALRTWLDGRPARSILAPEESESGPLVARGTALAACVRATRHGGEALPALLREAWDEGRVTFRRWPASPPAPVTSPSGPDAAERALLHALRAPEDGPLIDRFVNRTCSAWLTRRLARWPITPNQVTLASLITGLVAAWLLRRPAFLWSLAGLLLFQLSVILDHSDGEIARLKFQFSRLGKWLDNWSDHAVDLAVVGGLSWRLAQEAAPAGLVALAILAAVGLTGSFVVVFRWTLRRSASPGRGHPLMALANRDGFCLTLWAAVLAGTPSLLLWLLATGANLFWLLWLVLLPRPARAGGDLDRRR